MGFSSTATSTNNLIRRRAFTRVDFRRLEEIERPNTFRAFADFPGVERIAFSNAELLADHAVKRRGVALNIDALNEHTRATHDGKLDIKRQVAFVAGHTRVDAHKVMPLLERKTLETGDGVLNDQRRIDDARLNLERFSRYSSASIAAISLVVVISPKRNCWPSCTLNVMK